MQITLTAILLVVLASGCAGTPKPQLTFQPVCANGKALVKPAVIFRTYLKLPAGVPLQWVSSVNEDLANLQNFIAETYFVEGALRGRLVGATFGAASLFPVENEENSYLIVIGKDPNPIGSELKLSTNIKGTLKFVETRYLSKGQLQDFFHHHYLQQESDFNRQTIIESAIKKGLSASKHVKENWIETLVTLDLTEICKDARNRDELFTK